MSLIWKIILKICFVYFLDPNFPCLEAPFVPDVSQGSECCSLNFLDMEQDLHTTQISKDINAQQWMNEKSFN